MKNKIELLAPAGDYEAFLAAVENGADAVYLGGKLLNARQFAGNFDSENLKKAIDYAHVRDVSVYLTANTLVTDSEMLQALELVEEAYLMGIDGVIVQDLGFAGILRRAVPDLELHASTQMTIYNLEGVKMLEQLGFKRVVLARELSVEEIAYIAKNTPLEIEVFIHGALCISYSGQCLLSSIIGGRSGNRGKCAQPCRLPYELVNSLDKSQKKANSILKGYLLSPKDICAVDILDRLSKAGVKSLKIEGRMKSPEYVATIVEIYRKYLDKVINAEVDLNVEKVDKRDLTQIFNRGGLSNGYLVSKTGKDMMCFEKPKNWGLYLGEVLGQSKITGLIKISLHEKLSLGDGIEIWNGEPDSPGTVVSEIKLNGKNADFANSGDVVEIGRVKGNIFIGNKAYKTSDKRLNLQARETYSGKARKKVPINGKLIIKDGEPLKFTVSDALGNEINSKGCFMPEKALNRALTKERLLEQINKTGSTPFYFCGIEIELGEGLSVPVSEINDIRRRSLEELEKMRARMHERKMSKEILECKVSLQNLAGHSRTISGALKVSVLLNKFVDGLDYKNINADRIYLPFSGVLAKRSPEKLKACRESGTEIYLWLPSITRGNYDSLIKTRLNEITDLNIDGVLAGNLSVLEFFKEHSDIKLMGDLGLNVFNSLTIDELYKLKLTGLTLSPELNLSQISHLIGYKGLLKEAVVYGRLPLMTSEYCPVGSTYGGFTQNSDCNNACDKGFYRLRDRIGMEFPVTCDKIDCRSTIFNANVLMIIDSLEKIKGSGVGMARINITDEGPDEIKEIVEMHRDVLNEGKAAITKHSEFIEQIKLKGFTKGHYFKGV